MSKKTAVILAALLMLCVGLLGFLHLSMAWMMWDVPAPPNWYNPLYWFLAEGTACVVAVVAFIGVVGSAKSIVWHLAACALAPALYALWYLLWPLAMGPAWA